MTRLRAALRDLTRRASLEALPLWLFALWAVLLVVRVHLPYLAQPSEQSIDEGYLMALGQRMLHGRMLPFVDGVAHSGPLFMLSGALLAAFDPFSWMPVRVAAVICFAATAALAFACGRQAGRPLAGAIAAAGVPFYASLRMDVFDAIPYNAELPAIMFALASLYACLRAVGDSARPPSLAWLCAAGVFTAFGALSKQVAVLLVLPHVAYVLIALAARDELAPRHRVRLALAYVAAGALPVLLLFAHFAAAGALRDAYYYLVTYNRDVYMFPFREISLRHAYRDWLAARPLELALCLTALSWGLVQLVSARGVERSWLRAAHRSGFDLTVTAMAVGGVIGARASMREFEHYYLLVIPGFSLVAGALLDRATSSLRLSADRTLTFAARTLLLAPLVLTGEVAWSGKSTQLTAWSTQHMHKTDLTTAHQEPPVCEYIRAHSAPTDPLFVWGFRAQLYVSCARLPATRFVFTTFIAGYVPYSDYPTEIEDTLAVPGSRELLIRELEESKPPIIVDAARTMAMRSFRRYPSVFQYIEQHYRMAALVGGDEVWLRRDLVAARLP